MEGEWFISLPCPKDDLAWVERALKAKSTRITARDMASKLGSDSTEDSKKAAADFSFDASEFLKS